jgi:hypothetical protein
MTRQLMAEEWNKFAGRILPLNASAVQRREMWRAFYAGAFALLMQCIELAESEERSEEFLKGVHQELLAFFTREVDTMIEERKL